ncbi:MAG: cation:proton antiporter [Prevotella sp.]
MEIELLSPLFFVVISLAAGAIMRFLLRNSAFPYTVGLFCLGILLGIMCRSGILDDTGILGLSIKSVGNISPDLILYIFLPVLIFDAAYELDIHIFRKSLLNATILAVPGVVAALLLTAALIMGIAFFMPGMEAWNWQYALMFGALVSATDPVAVVALLKELGTSKRFSTLVDTESLLNDGTGIVMFMLFFTAASTGAVSFSTLPSAFCRVVAGGVVLGYLMSRLSVWFIHRVRGDLMVQISAVILTSYVTFFMAEGLLHVSGVIALVSFGVTLTYIGKPRLNPEANRFMENFWGLAGYMANTLIFILVGIVISMRVDVSWTGLLTCLGIYAGVNIIRLLVIFLFYPVMKRCGYGLTVRECLILGWGGLRGALGLTLALIVSISPSIPDEIRKQVLFFTAAIVTLTLLLNATTVRWLLGRLGLTGQHSASFIDYSLRERERENTLFYFEKLRKREMLIGADWERVSSYLPSPISKPKAETTSDIVSAIRLRLLNKEKQLSAQLCTEGIISVDTLRSLTVSTDALFDHDGNMPLNNRKSIVNHFSGPMYIRLFRSTPAVRRWMDQRFHGWVVVTYDLGRGFLILQKEAQKTLNELLTAKSFSDAERRGIQAVANELQEIVCSVEMQLNALRDDFPVSFCCALTSKAVRMLLCERRRTWSHYAETGLITAKELSTQLDNINQSSPSIGVFKQWMNAIRKI